MLSLTSFVMVAVVLLMSNKVYGDEQKELCLTRCGVHNISYPFRLKDSPEECGDKRYNLSCEDNNQLILYYEFEEYHGKYYVQSINYNNLTIRLLDFNLASYNNSIPHYSLGLYNFSSNFFTSPYLAFHRYKNHTNHMLTKSMLYGSCPNRMEYSYIGNCMNRTSYSQDVNSFYVGGYGKSLSQLGLGDGCHIQLMYLTSWDVEDYGNNKNNNISCMDIRHMMFYGFELSWHNILCEIGLYAQLDQYNHNNTFRCRPPEKTRSLALLARIITICIGSQMARPFEMIADIDDKKDFWKLAVKVLDKWVVVKDGKEHSEMIIVDAKGNDIQVMIPTAYKAEYEKLIQEKNTYTLSNFQVQTNDLLFKASDHKYKLKWTGGTIADQVNVHEIPDVGLKFKPFAEIVAGRWRSDLLVHVIGFVNEMGYCQMTDGTSKKLQVNFILKDLSDIPLNCTLWEDYAAKFIKFSNERKEVGPIIVMLKYAKIKEEGRYPLSVTNTYSVTKLFINDDIPEIKQFKESLPKEELLESQSQIVCTQAYSGSQFNTEDEITANNLIMPLSEIIHLDQMSYCVTVVKVEKVKSTKYGWFYLACCKCPKIAKGEKPPYMCDSGHNTETEIVRYKLELEVSYQDTKGTFVVWDREVTQMLGISAAQLRKNMIEAGITNRLEYPLLIDSLNGKTMVFKVKWQPKWKSSSVICCKEGTDLADLIVSKFPNAEVLALPSQSTEVVDNPSDNLSITEDVNISMSLPDLSGTAENELESLSQMTPISHKTATPISKDTLDHETTPDKLLHTPVLPLPGSHDEITPAKRSTSKRVKLIKTEKK